MFSWELSIFSGSALFAPISPYLLRGDSCPYFPHQGIVPNVSTNVLSAGLAPEKSEWTSVKGMGDRTVGFRQRLQSEAYYQLLRLVYPHKLLRAILLEFRSLILRIQILHKTKLYLPGKLQSPRLFWHAIEYPPSCKCEIAYIRDTRAMLSKHPWATFLDEALFGEGWEMGARAHSCRREGSPCCCNRSKGSMA